MEGTNRLGVRAQTRSATKTAAIGQRDIGTSEILDPQMGGLVKTGSRKKDIACSTPMTIRERRAFLADIRCAISVPAYYLRPP